MKVRWLLLIVALVVCGMGCQKKLTEEQQDVLDDQLLAAIAIGSEKDITKALDAGAYIDVKDDEGLTPLMLVTIQKQCKKIELLCSKGANINVLNNDGSSALIIVLFSKQRCPKCDKSIKFSGYYCHNCGIRLRVEKQGKGK